MQQPILQFPQVETQLTPPVELAADPTSTHKELFAAYAGIVAKLEDDTAYIPSKDTKHRSKFYWAPLNESAGELQAKYQVSGYTLAEAVEQGLSNSWPTNQPSDGRAVARMLRRIRSEQLVNARRAVARANMAALDALCAMIVSQSTAAGTAQNGANAATGRALVLGSLPTNTFPAPGASASYTCPLSHSHGFS